MMKKVPGTEAGKEMSEDQPSAPGGLNKNKIIYIYI